MATYSRKLKDSSGNYIVPVTRSKVVYFDDNSTLSKLTFFPIGSIYQSTGSTSPASLFGGSWEKIENRFLYGSGTNDPESTGGEEKHTLTTSEMPSHKHEGIDKDTGLNRALIIDRGEITGSSDINYPILQFSTSSYFHMTYSYGTSNVGGSAAHNNMPPYFTVNIWRRTA